MLQSNTRRPLLIGRLCEHCALTAETRKIKRITRQHVDEAVKHLIAVEDENASRPLKETRRALESNPTALLDVLDILEHGPMPPYKLRLDPKADVDDLQLSGAVRVDATGGQQRYSIRNEYDEQYLRRHFEPNHVVQVLTMSGQWQDAIKYLTRLASTDKKFKIDLLNTVMMPFIALRTNKKPMSISARR